jgi:hypothetical protein
MSGELSIGEYIDVKISNNDWAIGRVIEKEGDMYKIRLDGCTTRHDTVKKFYCLLDLTRD